MTCGTERQLVRVTAHRAGFTLVELVVVIGIVILLVAITAAVSTSLVSRSEIQRTESTLHLLNVAMEDYTVSADRIVTYGIDNPGLSVVYDMQMDEPHALSLTHLLRIIGRMPSIRDAIAQIGDEYVWRRNAAVTQPTTEWMRLDGDDPDPNAIALTATSYLDGDLVILDAWETPIRIIHPGRLRDALLPLGGPNDPEPADAGSMWPSWTRTDPGNSTSPPVEDDGTVFLHDTPPFTGMELFYGMCRNRKICFVSAGPDKKFGNVNEPVGSDLYNQSLDNLYSYEAVRP